MKLGGRNSLSRDQKKKKKVKSLFTIIQEEAPCGWPSLGWLGWNTKPSPTYFKVVPLLFPSCDFSSQFLTLNYFNFFSIICYYYYLYVWRMHVCVCVCVQVYMPRHVCV